MAKTQLAQAPRLRNGPSDPLFIGFYTPGLYEGEARLLRVSLEALGLDHDIREVPDPGAWQESTHIKPRFVREMMRAYPGRPLVQLDVDCIVLSHPRLLWTLASRCDVAAHVFPGPELLAGTLYFAPTRAAVEVVDEWIATCEANPRLWDQRCLAQALERCPARFVKLPYRYTWMVGGQQMTTERLSSGPPVIAHTRGSFRFHPDHD